MIPAVFRSMTASMAAKSSRASIERIRKRHARLAEAGLDTKAMREFKYHEGFKPKTRNEHVAHAKKMAELDRSPGLRAKTAGQVATREARQATIASAKDFSTMMQMDRKTLQMVLKAKLRSLEGKASRVEAKFDGTHATKRYREFLKTISDDPTYNQLRSYVSQANRIEAYEGIDTKGAGRQEARGVDWFGEGYKKYDDSQKSAIWDEVHKMAQRESLSSATAVSIVKGFINGDVGVAFSTDQFGNVKANFGTDQNQAAATASREDAMAAAKRRILGSTAGKNNPMGPWAPV